MRNTRQTAVIGARGYAGQELARLLLAHPRLQGTPPLFLGRERDNLAQAHPALLGLAPGSALTVEPFPVSGPWSLLEERGVDTVFLATPHAQSRAWAPEALRRGLRVIDLSGAWRLQDAANRSVYGFEDADPTAAEATQAEAAYGLPELHASRIATARLVANPGCYATSVILALRPLVAAGLLDPTAGIVCDAKSGVSGAGREPTPKTHFMYAADNLSAYGLWNHRHAGELREQLSLSEAEIVFTPHLLPIPRGILATVYVRLGKQMSTEELELCFDAFYRGRPMVRLFRAPQLPQIAWVAHTAFCDLGVSVSSDGRRAIIVSCLDNLLKGAASQAVQNWNLMSGFPESEGLLPTAPEVMLCDTL